MEKQNFDIFAIKTRKVQVLESVLENLQNSGWDVVVCGYSDLFAMGSRPCVGTGDVIREEVKIRLNGKDIQLEYYDITKTETILKKKITLM